MREEATRLHAGLTSNEHVQAQKKMEEAMQLVLTHFGSKHPRAVAFMNLLVAQKNVELLAKEGLEVGMLVR